MDTSVNNTKAFTDAIKQVALAQCKKIDEETYEIREQRLKALQSEAKERYQGYIEYEISRIKNETNRKIAKLHEDAKMQLTTKRNELSDKVFTKVLDEIKAFCENDEYKSYLIKSAQEISAQFADGEIEFFLNERDMKYSSDISKSIPEGSKISQSNDIKIGGIKAIDYKTKCLADNTIDYKINSQKEWFFEQSGLKI